MGSYKSPNMGYNYSYLTYNPTYKYPSTPREGIFHQRRSDLPHPQRAQYPLIKEYGLNYKGLHIMI